MSMSILSAERMLLQLEYAGILNRQSAIVPRQFSGASPTSMTPAGSSGERLRVYVPVRPFR